MEKYNSSAAVLRTSCMEDRFTVILADGGSIALYSAKKTGSVWCCGAEAVYEYDDNSGLLTIHSDQSDTNEITIITK